MTFLFRSFGELAYLCFGRSSVYVINFVITFGTFGIIVMYMLLFGKITSSFFEMDRSGGDDLRSILLSSKATYCILVYILLFPAVLKKEMKELQLTSIMLFFGVISMVVIFFIRFVGSTVPSSQYRSMEKDKELGGSFIDSICIILSSYGFVINFFPIYSSLDKRTSKNGI